jgi:peptide subunit release factor 1 (eRF1)
LLYVLDENERYGVVYVDHDRLRFFEVFLGDIEEIADAFLNLGGVDSHKIATRPAVRFYQGAVLGGGARGNHFERHLEAWVQRFYKHAAQLLRKQVDERLIDAVILMGPQEDTHFFENYLPYSLRQRITALVPSLPNPGASAGQVLKQIMPAITRRIEAREMALLQDQVRERGRWGPRLLEQLQMGRLHLLVAPWNLNATVWCCYGGLVLDDPKEAEAFCPGETVKEVALREVLVDLASAYGARLEFVQGEAEKRLFAEFGGLAGLPRW